MEDMRLKRGSQLIFMCSECISSHSHNFRMSGVARGYFYDPQSTDKSQFSAKNGRAAADYDPRGTFIRTQPSGKFVFYLRKFRAINWPFKIFWLSFDFFSIPYLTVSNCIILHGDRGANFKYKWKRNRFMSGSLDVDCAPRVFGFLVFFVVAVNSYRIIFFVFRNIFIKFILVYGRISSNVVLHEKLLYLSSMEINIYFKI